MNDHIDLSIKPIDEADTIHASMATHSDFIEIDENSVFKANWIYITSRAELESKKFIKMTIGKSPIIAFLDSNKKIKVFYDVCKHRSGPIHVEDKRLICGYHGWTYDMDGNLRGTPEMTGIKNFDKTCFGLNAISFREWNGLIFIALNSAKDFDQMTKGIRERISPIDLTSLKYHSKVSYTIKCNWKVYIENYLEGYHLPHVHPGLSKLLDYRQYRTELNDFYSLQFSPFKAGENIYSGETDGEAFYYFIYPNVMLNILPNRMQINLILPIDENHCTVVFDYLYAADKIKDESFVQQDLAYSDEIQQEDINICEKVQVRLESGVYKTGRYSPIRETGLHHFHNLYKSDVSKHR